MPDLHIGDRVHVEGVVTHVESPYVEVRLETGGWLRILPDGAHLCPAPPAQVDLDGKHSLNAILGLANELLCAGTLSDAERIGREIRDLAAGSLEAK